MSALKTEIEPLLSAEKVCEMFKISKPTLYRWINFYKFPAIKIGRRRYFKGSDVLKYLKERTE